MNDHSPDVERLLELLQAEEALYTELRTALQDEQVCLVNLEAEGLDDAVRQKETLVTEARVLEEGRRTLVGRLHSRDHFQARLAGALGAIARRLL